MPGEANAGDPKTPTPEGAAGKRKKKKATPTYANEGADVDGPKPALASFKHVWDVLEGVARKCGDVLPMK